MPLEKKDIDEVAVALGQTVEKFKAANDARIEAIEQEKATLSGKVSDLQNSVVSLQKYKDALELQLKEIENAQSRPKSGKSTEVSEHEEAFKRFMRKGDENGLAELEQKALNLGSDGDGGYAVPEDLDTNISSLLRNGTPMRQLCRVITVGNEEYKKLFNLNGASSGWVGETAARPETNSPTIAQITPTFGEIYASPAATQKSLDDMFFNAESWLGEEVQLEFSEQENAAYTNGDGVNKPPGLLQATTDVTLDEARAFGTFQHVVSSASGTISPDDIKIFPYKVKAGYRTNGSWMMQGLTLETIMVMKDGNDQYLWRAGLEDEAPMRLIGKRVVENEDMPALAAGANAIAFGDFQRAYTILDRVGTRVLRDPFTNKPYVHFYTTKRVGGMRSDSRSVKFLQPAA